MFDKIKSKFEMTEEQKVEAVKKLKSAAGTIVAGVAIQVAVHYGSKAITGQIDSFVENWKESDETK